MLMGACVLDLIEGILQYGRIQLPQHTLLPCSLKPQSKSVGDRAKAVYAWKSSHSW